MRKALSAILRTGEWFGTGHLIDILTGTATQKVRDRGHDGLPTFSVGRDLSRPAWEAVFRQMMGRDLVRPDPERHGALKMTEAARPILRGEEQITLRRDTVKSAAARPQARALISEEDAPLLSALKAKRRALAEAAGVPAYVIFTDRTLIEMAERRPQTLDEMAGITASAPRSSRATARPSLPSSPARPRPPCIPSAAVWRGGVRPSSSTGWPRRRSR